MLVKVGAILTFREILGSREQELEVPEGTTVEGLLKELMRRFGNPLIRQLWDTHAEKPREYVRLLVNGQDIAFLGGLATQLNEGDGLLIIPPASGG